MANFGTNNHHMSSYDLLSLHPVAVISAARTERSLELARLIYIAANAVSRFTEFSWAALKDAYEYNRSVNELEAMSDHMLKDIGLPRCGISHAVRSQMDESKQKVEVVAPTPRTIGSTPVVLPAANANKIEKHDLAA